MSFLGFAVLCGGGLAVLWVAVWWSFNDGETEMKDKDERWEIEMKRVKDKFFIYLFIYLFYNTATVQFYL